MKRFIISIAFALVYTFGMASSDIPLTPNDLSGTGRVRPRILSCAAISSEETLTYAELNADNLTVQFTSNIGIATITITNTNNEIVTQTSIDTGSAAEVSIATNELESGNYTVTIEYNNVSLSGYFAL